MKLQTAKSKVYFSGQQRENLNVWIEETENIKMNHYDWLVLKKTSQKAVKALVNL